MYINKHKKTHYLVNKGSRRLQPHAVAIAQPTIGFRGETSLESAMRGNPQLHVAPPDYQGRSSLPRSDRDAGRGGREIGGIRRVIKDKIDNMGGNSTMAYTRPDDRRRRVSYCNSWGACTVLYATCGRVLSCNMRTSCLLTIAGRSRTSLRCMLLSSAL